MNLTWLDVVLAGLIIAGALRGFLRGFVREGMAFGGLAVGLVLASQWYTEVAGVLRPFVGGGKLLDGLAYLFVVLVILSTATLLTVFVTRAMRFLSIGWLDGVGGFGFGAAQGAVVAVLLLVIMKKYPFAGLDAAVRDSGLASSLLGAVPAVLSHLPRELGDLADFFGPAGLP